MKSRLIIIRIVLLFAIILAFSFLFTSCQLRNQRQPEKSLQSASKSTFPNDDLERPVNLSQPAQRVAVIGPGATEVLFDLGLGGRIVGRDQISDYPPTTSQIPIIGNFTGPFFEKVIAVHPDLLIMQGETWDATRVETYQQKTGVPVAALTAPTLQAAADDIRKMGAWLGETTRADALAAKLDAAVKDAPTADISAFIQISNPPLWTAGSGTLVSDVAAHCGFSNVAKVSGYKEFSMESLLALDPDVYIVPSDEDAAKVLSALRNDAQLRNLKAIKNGNVIVIKSDLLLRPGPRLLEGIAQLRAAARKYHS